MSDEKHYTFEVTLKFTQVLSATNDHSAIQNLKETFADEYNLEITNEEIKGWDDKGKKLKFDSE